MFNVKDSAHIPELTWKHQALGWSPKRSISEATQPKAADKVEFLFYQLCANLLLASSKGFPGPFHLQCTQGLWQEEVAEQI